MATANALLEKYKSIFNPEDGFLAKHNVERNEEIALLGLTTISGVDPLLLGDPGTGKTWLIELLVEHALGLSDIDLFNIMLMKDMSPNEVLGPPDVMAMKAGKQARIMDGFLPTAKFGYLDEIFKASPPMLNSLLDLLAKRQLKVGGTVHDCSQLITIFASSNELPDREDLRAMRDRLGLTKFVRPVRTPEGLRAVTDIQLDYQSGGLDTTGLIPMTLDDIAAIRIELRAIEVNAAMREVMVKIEQRCQSAGHEVSQRRKGQCWRVIKANAWANGRTSVVADDFLPIQHQLWNLPDHVDSAREIVLDFASVFARKAARLNEALEPVIREMEELRQKIERATTEEDKDELLNDGFKYMRQLKKLQRETREQIVEGQEQGHDTAPLTDVETKVVGALEWAEKALTGTENGD